MTDIEVTVLMPCLNEAETVAVCVGKALGWLRDNGVAGEVLVADNGSTDGSQQLATAAGARVIDVPTRGYGSALRAGLKAARGRLVIMGDADDSYDFTALGPFVAAFRDGADLVMGNRFRGGIDKGAMPFLHRYLGNPVLSWLGRLFFKVPVGDFHCGLRAVRRDRVEQLRLRTTGMEFASELVVRAGLNRLDIREVPTPLHRAGRSRAPHLRTWRDGWRHLRFLLLYAPAWLFLIPGAVVFTIGVILTVTLSLGAIDIGAIRLDVGALLFSAALVMVGAQAIAFALFTNIYAVARGYLPSTSRLDRLGARFTLERGLLVGFLVLVGGVVATVVSFLRWGETGWGDLDPREQIRIVVPAVVGLVVGAGIVLGSFFLSILGMEKQHDQG